MSFDFGLAGPFLPVIYIYIYVSSPVTNHFLKRNEAKFCGWFVCKKCVDLLTPGFLAFGNKRQVHGMPSEFSLEFGSAMLMVRRIWWKFRPNHRLKSAKSSVAGRWYVIFFFPNLYFRGIKKFAEKLVGYKRKRSITFARIFHSLWLFGFPKCLL